jgi:hypothetical protein
MAQTPYQTQQQHGSCIHGESPCKNLLPIHHHIGKSPSCHQGKNAASGLLLEALTAYEADIREIGSDCRFVTRRLRRARTDATKTVPRRSITRLCDGIQ